MTKPEPFCDEELFWNDRAESVVREEPETTRVYDLEERTARFGESIVDFVKLIPQDALTSRLISQLVGAATSVGATLRGSRRRRFKEGLSKNHWNLPKGS